MWRIARRSTSTGPTGDSRGPVPRAVVVAARVAGLLAMLTVPGVSRAAQAAPAPVTFARDVAPLLATHCVVCHRPDAAAPFSLTTFEAARQRARLIAAAVTSRAMPPWQPDQPRGTFADERRLTASEIAVFAQWVTDGLLPGDLSSLPAMQTVAADWQLGAPDLVIAMPEAFTVPADGADVFRNVVLPIPLSDRRFVRALEFRPGNPRVVHHVRLLFDDTGELRRKDGADAGVGFGGMDAPGARFPEGHFLGWAPGKRPTQERYPWPLEPGNDLVVQMHLKPTGRPEAVRVSVGLYFTDTPPSTTPILVRLGSKDIDIPAGAARFDVVDRFTLPTEVTLVSIAPHAHYLATTMTVTAARPDGRVETLLRIPTWNFNWQDEYAYAAPMTLPRGTTLEMRYRYDNSAGNPHNPSVPPSRVRFGSDTRDEMGELLVQVLARTPADAENLRRAVARKNLLTDIAGEEKRLADVPNDAATRIALGVAYVQQGRVADAVAQFDASLAARPDLAMAHYNLGVVSMGDGRPQEAIARFERAITLQPEYPEAHNNLGIVLESTGRLAEAAAHYRVVLASRPNHVAARNNLGRVLLAQGEADAAEEQFRQALRVRPDNADLRYNLGRALFANGHVREAVGEWRLAVAARPDSVVFALDLAVALATRDEVRNTADAIALAESANKSARGENPAALDVLAMAYAADGRLDLALEHARRAVQRATAQKQDGFAAEIQRRLDEYEQRRRERAAGARNP